MEKAYISLGSNKGQKLENLQDAVLQIQKQVGILTDLSSIYETPSWGFEGPDFFNACIGIQTDFSPAKLLQKLLKIERKMGRLRTTDSGYSSRNIDLDLLFFEDQVIDNDDLILPHPRLELRNFILHPMCEIAPDFVHPRLGKDMTHLLNFCRDTSHPTQLPLSRWSQDLFFEDQLLVFEGNIGVGKTSLAQKIAQDFKVPSLLENFGKNPFLEKFYDQPDRFALPLENYFLEDRFRQFDDFVKASAALKMTVADHSLFKSLVFAKINLSPKHFQDFKANYERLSAQLVFKQKVIFLHQPIEKLMKQIKSRGRIYEQKITPYYLEKIEEGYQNYRKERWSIPYHSIDLTDLDFIHDERAYQMLLQRIKAF
jgi:deoxyguanosine kinase